MHLEELQKREVTYWRDVRRSGSLEAAENKQKHRFDLNIEIVINLYIGNNIDIF